MWMAMAGAFLGAVTASKEIKEKNEALQREYKQKEDLINFQQQNNWNYFQDNWKEVQRQFGTAMLDIGSDINTAASKVQSIRGKGITAGNSTARSLRKVYLKGSKAIGRAEAKTSNTLTDMYTQVANQNNKLQEEKISDYNRMQANFIDGATAGMMIIGQALSGARMGNNLENTFKTHDRLNKDYEELQQQYSKYMSMVKDKTFLD